MSDPTYIDDLSTGYRLECDVDSDTLLCTFGGMWLTGATPGFQFVHLTQNWLVKKAFFTDIDQVWYQKGVRGIGEGVEEVADFIRDVADREGVRRIITVGNSMGGYAAILFGVLAGAEVALAFSPQTNLTKHHYTAFPERLDKVYGLQGQHHPYLRLCRIVDEYNRDTLISVHFAHYFPKDRRNASDLWGATGVKLHGYPMMSHNVAPVLKEQGHLQRLLRGAVQGHLNEITEPTWKNRLSIFKSSCAYLAGRGMHSIKQMLS